MLVSLFEVYDPFMFILNFSFNWLFFFFFFGFFIFHFMYKLIFLKFFSFMYNLFISYFNYKFFNLFIVFFISFFFYLFFVNFLGLLPYVFSVSSHFVFCLSFSLPFWLSLMVMGYLFFFNFMFYHLIPSGTPFLLIIFMVFIESISSFMRPVSLSVRLMANMVSGHLLMSLLGDCGFFFFFFATFFFYFWNICLFNSIMCFFCFISFML
uniref:ATP synthase subunit a n=1 Tax=Vasdavidius concursus TaxID=290153 RepID=Q5URQ2_9HEMI|nr:ATP synthase subunit 6 [Vasdavidius concursus]